MGAGTIKKGQNLTRRQKIGSCLGALCIFVIMVAGVGWFLLEQDAADWPASSKVVARAVSPDGAYLAVVTDVDWGIGGVSKLQVTPEKRSSFAVRLSRLFARSYSDDFDQIESVQWMGKRTLKVVYDAIPGGDGSHATSWGDVKFDYRTVSVQ